MNTKTIKIVIVLLVAVGLFFGGVKYGASMPQSSKSAIGGNQAQFGSRAGTAGQFAGRNGAGRGAAGNGVVAGEVLSKDDKSITLKLTGGGSEIVFLGASTMIMKSVEGSLDDVQVGKTVSISGNANSDGSITAQSIQLRNSGSGMASTTMR